MQHKDTIINKKYVDMSSSDFDCMYYYEDLDWKFVVKYKGR